jgi:hypothetical protein
MKKLLLILALVGLMAGPATADLHESGKLATGLQHTGTGTVGISDGAGGIYLSYKTTAVASDIIMLDFAFHWPYATTVYVGFLGHNFVWDSSEVQVIGASSIAPWAAYNYTAGSFPNFTSGTWTLATLYEDFPGYWTNTFPLPGSAVVPFMHVTLHVKDVIADSYLDVIISTFHAHFALTPNSSGGWWTGGAIGAPAYGMGVVPEPASMTLLAGGLLAIGAGVWRRRR